MLRRTKGRKAPSGTNAMTLPIANLFSAGAPLNK
jgi:hypothetical protein